MPFYEYECRKCGAEFTALRSMDDRDAPYACPECGETRVERKISTFATCCDSSGSGAPSSASSLPCGGGG